MSFAFSKSAWFWGKLDKLGILWFTLTLLHVDNISVIQNIANLVFHEIIKHIEVYCHYIHEALDQYMITLLYIFTKFQMANVFKVLSRHQQIHG